MSEIKLPHMIQQGYKQWIDEPARKKSPELDFGAWWQLFPNDSPLSPQLVTFDGQPVIIVSASAARRWRVSWIDDTGELYAHQAGTDNFIVLGHFEARAQVDKHMEGWANKAHALVDFFPHLYVCERYRAELARLYGRACADASVVQQGPEGAYLVSVAVQRSGEFILDEEPQEHTLDEMAQMLTELRKRKPPPSAKVRSLTQPYPSNAPLAAISAPP